MPPKILISKNSDAESADWQQQGSAHRIGGADGGGAAVGPLGEEIGTLTARDLKKENSGKRPPWEKCQVVTKGTTKQTNAMCATVQEN